MGCDYYTAVYLQAYYKEGHPNPGDGEDCLTIEFERHYIRKNSEYDEGWAELEEKMEAWRQSHTDRAVYENGKWLIEDYRKDEWEMFFGIPCESIDKIVMEFSAYPR